MAFSPLKSLSKSAFAGHVASFLIGSYIRLLGATVRPQIRGVEHLERHLETNPKGAIIVFWHSQISIMPLVRRHVSRPAKMLVSNHRDGDIIANAVRGFGIDFIRGSTSNQKKKFKQKDGVRAFIQMAKAIERGDIVGITPDGPRGPAGVVHPGVVKLSNKTGAPILACAFAASRSKRLNTWDRFQLVFPFSRIALVLSPPVQLSGDEDMETAAQMVADTMNDALKTAGSTLAGA